MKLLLINILLALSWAAVSGSFSFMSLLFGFLLGAVALSFIRAEIGSLNYFVRVRRIASLMILFLYELVMSSVKVAMTVLRPRLDVKPGIVAYPLKVDRDFEITLLANLVTLTPGTMSVDISEDRRLLYIHALDASDPDQLRHDIASGFERKILEAFR